jgi:hypothetical protein
LGPSFVQGESFVRKKIDFSAQATKVVIQGKPGRKDRRLGQWNRIINLND